VNGVCARALGLTGERTFGVAMEGNLPFGRVSRGRYRGRAVIEVGTVPGGYGWVFAKGDHANFGVAGWESAAPKLRDHLRRLCDAYDGGLKQALGDIVAASWDAKLALDRFPALTFGLLRPRPVWRVIDRVIRGDLAHQRRAAGLARLPIEGLTLLARIGGSPG